MWQPGWEGNLGENACICMFESLRCSPETATTLLIGYIRIQNIFKKFKRGGGPKMAEE